MPREQRRLYEPVPLVTREAPHIVHKTRETPPRPQPLAEQLMCDARFISAIGRTIYEVRRELREEQRAEVRKLREQISELRFRAMNQRAETNLLRVKLGMPKRGRSNDK